MSKAKILIIGNYPLYNQESMKRYANLLVSIYQSIGQPTIIAPQQFLTKVPGLPHLVRKYIAYIDQYIFFAVRLLATSWRFDLIHIADHGNSPFLFCCPADRTLITCHDLLAARAAMGDDSLGIQTSGMGIWQQRTILHSLKACRHLCFDSQATANDFRALTGDVGDVIKRREVIPIPLNAEFSPRPSTQNLSAEEQQRIPDQPYLLMVGSSHPRKNRVAGVRLMHLLGSFSPYLLVLAGGTLSRDEQQEIEALDVSDRVWSVAMPSHELLNSLYVKAHALLMPSLSEGFGWPLIEAQACDCPVIASTTTSLPEVAGDGALYVDPHDFLTMAHHVHYLEDNAARQELLVKGRDNLSRFSLSAIRSRYVAFAAPVLHLEPSAQYPELPGHDVA